MNFTPAQRGWYLMQLGERALNANRYDQAYSYGEMARAYFSFPAGTDDDSYTVWFTYAPVAGNTLAIDFTLSTVTNTSAAPADGDIVWDFGDRPVWSHTVTTKALTSNVATLTFAGAHDFKVGDKINVALAAPDAVFDGAQTITAVTSTTVSYAKTNANITAVASGGTVTQGGGATATVRHVYAAAGNYNVVVTVDSAANPAVVYSVVVAVPYKA
jgi:hypothetical protein